MFKSKKNKGIATGPYLGSLIAISLGASTADGLQEKLELDDEQAILVMNECLKAELGLVWLNVVGRQKNVARDYFDYLLATTHQEVLNTPELPELQQIIDSDPNAWKNDIIDYYLKGNMTKEAEEWINSPMWSGGEGPVDSKEPLIELVLKLHYRVFHLLGKNSIRDAGAEAVNGYIILSSSLISSQNSVWTNVVFQLENPERA
jgi:hypothetical protein